ncbi:MAG: carboxylating nicotinate-nucleotide diphosphorylase [Acidimicrobiia bacterium]|nr:carboxylating nicotinate-nucleotide diphosphorylase [Acidimicrobiia bacterium]
MSDYEAPIHVVRDAVELALAEDLGPLGDVTAALLPESARGSAVLNARALGVLAGTACVTETFAQLDESIDVALVLDDGAPLEPGTVIGTISGPLRPVLTGERTALNFLCHLSGVASLTHRFVTAASGRVQIWDTRKTLPGLRALEKAAVRAGGGANHRGSLSDMVLVKDNHLGSLGVAGAVKLAREQAPNLRVEVECERAEQVVEAVTAGADMVMLDNMTPTEAADCVRIVRESGRPATIVEISGGITLDNVADYAASGADVISTSAITQSAPALDIGLDLTIH